MKKIIFSVCALLIGALLTASPFLVFDFNGDNLIPSTGSGTITLIGGATDAYAAGWTGTTSGGRALNTSGYPASSASPETAGINVAVSTAGRSNIVVTWNQRNSNTGANRLRLKYTLDGVTWIDFDANESNATNMNISLSPPVDRGFDNGMFITNTNVGSSASEGWYLRVANFSSIPGANDNPSFAVRFVTAFPTGASEYGSSGGTSYGTSGTLRYDNLTFSHTDSNQVLTPVASPIGGTYYEPFNVTLSCPTPDATIYYQFGIFPEPIVYTYTQPFEISEYTVLVFWAVKEGMVNSETATETYIMPINITELAQLRTYTPGDGLLFYISTEVIVTYTQDFRNQKFIQDETGAVLIDDFPGVITHNYQIGDGIVGLTGTTIEFGNMLQFSPTEDPGLPSSTGHTIIPTVITMEDFLEKYTEYESRLVAFQNVKFVNPTGNFAIAQVYEVTDGTHIINFRATFQTDYLGQPIISDNLDLIGFPNARAEGRYITARFKDDFRAPTVSISDKTLALQHKLIGNYPNPFNPNTTIAFEIVKPTNVNIAVFNIRGQKVNTLVNEFMQAGSHNVTWNGIDENGLDVASGFYFYRLQTDDGVDVKRAILMK